MTELKAPYTADPPPDGPEPLAPGAPLPYTARLDSATLHAWITAATDLFAGLLTASHMPADWPRDQAWPQTVLLPRDARERITALLAGNLPPDPLQVEFNRVLGMLEAKDAECQAVKAERDAWHAQAVTSADLLGSNTDAHEALSAEVARLQAERDRLREQIAALATERDGWQQRALSAERVATVPAVAKGQR